MSDKRGAAVKSSVGDASVQLERMLSKGKYKEAVKQAKLIHKAESTPESHRQLEHAYFLRAQQLLREGMPESAVEVSRHLLEFGVTDAKLVEEFAPLLVKLGLAQDAYRIQGRLESPASQNRLQQIAADQAVLHPERSHRSSPQIPDAALVRQALEALSAGDDASALSLVRDIARTSPLSEWKLLVRGLSAFYKGDHEEARANWSRLDPERAPKRIADNLQNLREASSEKNASVPDFDKLEKLVYGEPILPRLRELSELVARNRWADALRRITALRLGLRAVDLRLDEKLTSSLLEPLLIHALSCDYATAIRLLREFTQVAAPLAIDPSWNRFWALCWDKQDPSEAVKSWTRYITDLESCAAFKPEERPLAQALVWKHIAELYLEEIEYRSENDDDDFEDDDGFDDLDLDDEDDSADFDEVRLMRQASACIEQSLRLAPRHRPTYDLLVDLSRMSDEPAKLSKAQQRILEAFPDDVEILIEMAVQNHKRGDQTAAIEHLSRARRHKPLDESLVSLEMRIRTSLACDLAFRKCWDEARAQFAAMEQLRPDLRRSYAFLARRSVFEIKASQGQVADRYEQEAAALLPEPAPLWLAMRVESARYRLSKPTQKHYGELWKKELRRKCRTETAGAMASFWIENVTRNFQYDGSDRDASELLKYLGRTTRLNYRLEDVENVCQFLVGFPREVKLLRKLFERGLKTYPESVILHVVAAGAEMKTPNLFRGADLVLQHLQTALRLAEASKRPDEITMVATIKLLLSHINEAASRFGGIPFGGLGGIPFLEEDEYEDDDGDQEEDRPGSFAGRWFPAFGQTGRSNRRKPKSSSTPES